MFDNITGFSLYLEESALTGRENRTSCSLILYLTNIHHYSSKVMLLVCGRQKTKDQQQCKIDLKHSIFCCAPYLSRQVGYYSLREGQICLRLIHTKHFFVGAVCFLN